MTEYTADSRVTTVDLLEDHTATHPDATFLAFPGAEWSYREVLDRSRSLAAGLRGLGVGRGDYVASMLPSSPEAVLSLFAVNCAGAAQVPLNIAYRGSLLEHALAVSTARVLIVHRELLDRLEGLDLGRITTLVVVGARPESVPAALAAVGWDDLAAHDPVPTPDELRPRPFDDMVVIFTSGTTGPSKGVRCSYLHHVHYAGYFRACDQGADDRVLVALPMFHVGGTALTFSELLWGGSVALLPRFSTDTFWDDVQALRPTWGLLVDAMASFLLKRPPSPADRDHRIRFVLVGSPRLAGPLYERFGITATSGFAMSEAPGPLRGVLPPDDLSSVGRPRSPEWRLRVVDAHDFEVRPGEIGELLLRHDCPWAMMSGYLGMPEATAEAWRGGWFHTGDLVIRDPDDRFHYVDRKKDALRRRGENISSFEVEIEIVSHPDVLEASAVATPSDDGEDEVLAFVALRPGSELSHAGLLEYLIPRMAHFMVPRYLEFVDELPKTPTNKVRKIELRERGRGPATWDRERAGYRLRAERIAVGGTTGPPDTPT